MDQKLDYLTRKVNILSSSCRTGGRSGLSSDVPEESEGMVLPADIILSVI